MDLRYSELFSLWATKHISCLPPLPPPSLSHHWFDRWSASTGCAAFHLYTSSLLPAISLPVPTIDSASLFTYLNTSINLLYNSCLLLPLPHIPDIPPIPPLVRCWAYRFQTVPCTSFLQVKNFLRRLPTIQPVSSIPSCSAGRYVPSIRVISVTRQVPCHLAHRLALGDCSTLGFCSRAKLPI